MASKDKETDLVEGLMEMERDTADKAEVESIGSSLYTKESDTKELDFHDAIDEESELESKNDQASIELGEGEPLDEALSKETTPEDPISLNLPDRGLIKDALRLNQADAIVIGNVNKSLPSYEKNSTNFLLQSKYNQLMNKYKSLDQKQKDAINSGTENIKNTFNSIKQTVGEFNQPFTTKIDWEFWEKIVNNYEEVILKDPDHLNGAINSGIPKEFRGIIWQLVSKSKNFELEEFFIQLKAESSIHEKSIKRDLTRTSFFTNVDQVGKSQELFNVIKAYSLFDPDVGYTQGMIFITVPLIMNMTDAECFCLLVTLMKDYRIRELFCPEMKGLHLFLFEFDKLLQNYSPILFNHLAQQGIKSSMYASQWFLTFFAYKFPLDIVLRIYDILITQGSEAILKFAVNLMIRNEKNLLLLKFDKLLEYLKDNLFNIYVDDEFKNKIPENDDNGGISKRFSILGNRKSTDSKSSGGNYYKLDELVTDSMSINVDPNELLRFEQEFESIYKAEEAKLNDIKKLKIENGILRKSIKNLELTYLEVNRDHVEILQKIVDIKLNLPETFMDNEDLDEQISQLQDEISAIENKVQSPISEITQLSSSSPHSTLPDSVEENINELLQENALQLEKFAELEAEYNDLLTEDSRLRRNVGHTRTQSWFNKWK